MKKMIAEIQQSMVDFYEPGIQSLAQQMGMSPEELEAKASLINPNQHLTYADTVLLQYVTGQHQILAYEAANLGYLLLDRKFKPQIPTPLKKYFCGTYEPEISLLQELPETPWSMLPD